MRLKVFTAQLFKMAAVVAACFALCAALGCSSSPTTLEEYYDAHPAELQKETQDFENSLPSDTFSGSSVEIKENHIIMTGQLTFNFSELDAETQQTMVSAVNEYLNDSTNVASMSQAAKDTEDATGIDGITISIVYTDNTGRLITSATYSSDGIV